MTVRTGTVAAVACALVCALAGCVPAPPEPPAGLTGSQRSLIVQAELDRRWAQITGSNSELVLQAILERGGDGGAQAGPMVLRQPRIEVVRYTTVATSSPVFADCMTEAGYPTRFTMDRGLVGPTDVDMGEPAYALARYTCQAQYPIDPEQLGYLSPAQSLYLYNYWANTLVPCLRGQGVPVPPLPPQDEFRAGRPSLGPQWDPYAEVRATRGDAVAPYVFARCPALPPALQVPAR